MNSDFKNPLVILEKRNVKYLVASGYAVIHHSQLRYTKDIDIWVAGRRQDLADIEEIERAK